ncbi:hypothetical protein AERO9AM_50152 [Aeromicrobium sp. 9AM]|nr:hypothetical protein AERO9AM_50152 [Aeromicrobium sp. 9AM]
MGAGDPPLVVGAPDLIVDNLLQTVDLRDLTETARSAPLVG